MPWAALVGNLDALGRLGVRSPPGWENTFMAQAQLGDLLLEGFSTALNALFLSAVKISNYSPVTSGRLVLLFTVKIRAGKVSALSQQTICNKAMLSNGWRSPIKIIVFALLAGTAEARIRLQILRIIQRLSSHVECPALALKYSCPFLLSLCFVARTEKKIGAEFIVRFQCLVNHGYP